MLTINPSYHLTVIASHLCICSLWDVQYFCFWIWRLWPLVPRRWTVPSFSKSVNGRTGFLCLSGNLLAERSLWQLTPMVSSCPASVLTELLDGIQRATSLQLSWASGSQFDPWFLQKVNLQLGYAICLLLWNKRTCNERISTDEVTKP